MVAKKENNVVPIPKKPKLKKAMDPESRENQMISYAVDLAEKQLKEGTASSAVIQHYLKMGTEREKLERKILKEQAALITAKTGEIASAKDQKDNAEKAIEAMKKYSNS